MNLRDKQIDDPVISKLHMILKGIVILKTAQYRRYSQVKIAYGLLY